MRYDVAPEDLITWARALGTDPLLLRQLAGLSRQAGTEAGPGAEAGDLTNAAGTLADRLDTVLCTLADAHDSLRARLAGGSSAYTSADISVRAAIGAGHG